MKKAIITIIFICLLLASCYITFSVYDYYSIKKNYPNPKVKIQFENKSFWNVSYYERSGGVNINNNYLPFEILTDVKRPDLVDIQIYASRCESKQIITDKNTDPLEQLTLWVESQKIMYNIETIKYIQPPVITKLSNKTISRAIIDLENSIYKPNQTKAESEIKYNLKYEKEIDIQIIEDKLDNFAAVLIYKGNNKEQNDQAEEIVNSLTWDCTVGTKNK